VVAYFVVVILGGNDAGHNAGHDRLAYSEWGDVALAGAHAAAQVRVHRQPLRAQGHLHTCQLLTRVPICFTTSLGQKGGYLAVLEFSGQGDLDCLEVV
jgi:hypothetical protein